MTIHKNYAPGVTRLSAAELRGMADQFRAALKPGLVTLTNTALALPYPVDSTTIALGPFIAGDAIVNAGAVSYVYYTDRIDLATAGDGGGPLPAGIYSVYLRNQRAGTQSNRFFSCYPALTDNTGAYDVNDPGYADAFRTGQVNYERADVNLLLVNGITWDGAQITNAASFWTNLAAAWPFREIFGCVDLTGMARGSLATVVIGGGRGLSVDSMNVFDFSVDELTINADGQVNLGANVDVLFANNPSIRFTGMVNEIIAEQGGLYFDMGNASTLRMSVDSKIQLLNGAQLEIDAASLLKFYGEATLYNGSVMQANAGAAFIGLQGSYLLVPPTPAATNPIANELTGKHLARAWALVDDDGTLLASLNVASINKTGTGEYEVVYGHGLSGGNYGGIATPQAVDNRAAVVAATSGTQATVRTFHDGFAADTRFFVKIYGGQLS